MPKKNRASAKGSRAVKVIGAAAGVVAAAVGVPMVQGATTQPSQPPEVEAPLPAEPPPPPELPLPKSVEPTLDIPPGSGQSYWEQASTLPRFYDRDAPESGLAYFDSESWTLNQLGLNQPKIQEGRDVVRQANVNRLACEVAAVSLGQVEVVCSSRLAEEQIQRDFSVADEQNEANPLASLAPAVLAGFLVEAVVKAALELIIESIEEKVLKSRRKADEGKTPDSPEALIKQQAMSRLKFKVLSERYGDADPFDFTSTVTLAFASPIKAARPDPHLLVLNRYMVLAARHSVNRQSLKAATERASGWLPDELAATEYAGDARQLAECGRMDAEAILANVLGVDMTSGDAR